MDKSISDKILDDLAGQGWSVIPKFISDHLVEKLLQEQKDLLMQGQFRNAGIGKGETFQVKPEIRGDKIMWLDQEQISSVLQEYLQKIENLRMLLNQEFFLGLKNFECHFAQYPPHTFYKKHLDQFKQTTYRIISCILYLNTDWKEEDGGQLRIYTTEDNPEIYQDVLPIGGTLVCFRSEDIPHEVLPTQRERYSITGWMRR
ncbi:2OG-Fe(II) oxygenase [soil metagenome]